VRQALRRELEAGHPLFQSGALLDRRDYERVLRGEWRDGFELPAREPALCPALSQLAFRMQKRRGTGDGFRVRVAWDDALALLGRGEEAERVFKGGEALHVIEEQWDDVLFVHQLFQDCRPRRRGAAGTGAHKGSLAGLRDGAEPRGHPRRPGRFQSAAARLRHRMGRALRPGRRHGARPGCRPGRRAHSAAQRQRLQQALMARSRDPEADLRARIAAARALGDLGDPRFERRRGPDGDNLLPPLVQGGARCSWNNNRDNARSAYRNDNTPGNRNNNLGLRLVCGSHRSSRKGA
jgi:hypothetical protein